MTTAIQAMSVLLPTLYLVAAMLYGMHFGGEEAPRVVLPRRAMLALALLAHLVLFGCWWSAYGGLPTFDAWSTVSTVALFLAVLHVVTSYRIHHAGTGAVVLSGVTLLVLGAAAFGALEPPAEAPLPGAFTLFHAVTMASATGALILSGLHGALYLILYRRMRARRFGPFERGLPSLDTLVRLTRRAALAGFLLLTVGINVGIGWAHAEDVAGFHYGDPLVLALIVLWVHFGMVAFSRKIPGLTSRNASIAAAAGLTVFLAVSLATLIPQVTFHWSS